MWRPEVSLGYCSSGAIHLAFVLRQGLTDLELADCPWEPPISICPPPLWIHTPASAFMWGLGSELRSPCCAASLLSHHSALEVGFVVAAAVKLKPIWDDSIKPWRSPQGNNKSYEAVGTGVTLSL